MGLRCPSCGMESAEDAAWCDFCKEPFRKTKKAEVPAAAAAPVPTGEKLSEDELLKRMPAEFLRGDDGEKLPTIPRWFKWLAWAFLAAWLVAGAILTIFLLNHKKNVAAPPRAPRIPG